MSSTTWSTCCSAAATHTRASSAEVPGRGTLSGRVLAFAPMRMIGDWSYSLYLWHWPAFILPPVALDRAMTPFEKGLAVLVVLTLSAYSYRFVEMPFRESVNPNTRERLRQKGLDAAV